MVVATPPKTGADLKRLGPDDAVPLAEPPVRVVLEVRRFAEAERVVGDGDEFGLCHGVTDTGMGKKVHYTRARRIGVHPAPRGEARAPLRVAAKRSHLQTTTVEIGRDRKIFALPTDRSAP